MKKAIKINPELFDSEKYDENKISECAEILLEAEEIKKDSVLMEKIKKHLDEKSKKITSLKQLKDKANNFVSEEEDQDE